MLVEEHIEDTCVILIPVHDLTVDGRTCRLFVGNMTAACDGSALMGAGITSSLNVSLNIDVPPVRRSDGIHMRQAKVGLIDGAGNTPAHLAAAVLALEGLVTQASPGKPHYPAHATGNVLVNCRGGRSRSVTVLATWLHLRDPAAFPTLMAAVAHVRQRRGSSDTYPLPPMIALAEAVLATGAMPALMG